MKRVPAAFCVIAILACAAYPPSSSAGAKMRIVSLAPSTTEILFALGAGDEVIGVSRFCDYPAGALAKERVGTFSQPNAEKILSLKPDIIFCTGLEQAPVVTKLKQLGLHVVVSDPASLEELFVSIGRIGELVERRAEAAALVSGMRRDLERLSAAAAGIPADRRPKIYVEIWHSPIMTAGGGSFLDEMITAAGGVNIAHDKGRQFVSISAEAVIERDPDVIVLAYMERAGSRNALMHRPGWGGVSAVKQRRVYNDIDPNHLLRPGPRLIEGIRELHERLYP